MLQENVNNFNLIHKDHKSTMECVQPIIFLVKCKITKKRLYYKETAAPIQTERKTGTCQRWG